MVGKIEYRNNTPLSIETERTQNVEQANPSSVQEKAPQNLGVGKPTDSFEQAKLSNSFEQQLPKSPLTGDTAYSVSELRQLISAARAENKQPFTEANLNKLLSANRDNYKEIAADLKGWINKNMYLSPRQKGPLDRMSEDDLKKVQDSAQTATELNKLMSVKITNYDDSSAEKVLKLQETEISDTVRLHYGKVQPSIADQHQQEAAQNAVLE